MSDRAQVTALLLVDLQNDFLERPGLFPERDVLCMRATALVTAMRRQRVPVIHAHTLLRADGSDRMPHWKRRGIWECVEGTHGALAPPGLGALDAERVFHKRFFSAFGNAELDPWLREHGLTRLLIAGVFLHGCVRSTVLDAYERGYEVEVVDDAVGTTDPLHGDLTRAYLRERCATFTTVDEIIELGERPAPRADGPTLTVAVIAGTRRPATTTERFVHRNPCRTTDVLAEVPLSSTAEVRDAADTSAEAAADWAATAPEARAQLLDRWAAEIDGASRRFADLIVRELAKPRRMVDEEIGRAVAHVRIAADLVRDPARRTLPIAAGVSAVRRALGVVALLTPWNNPLAIAVGKIAPALAFGNGVVFKPAPQASATGMAIMETLAAAGLPLGIVNLVHGGADTARALCFEPRTAAISVTGSLATGRAVAAYCAQAMKPLQAELGGNNAALVLRDAELEEIVPILVRAAFGFAGQRCTASRRFVVEEPIAERFEALARAASAGLATGEPDDPSTEVGPLISVEKRDRVIAIVEEAVSAGARLAAGGYVPGHLAHGAWLAPTLLSAVDPRSRVAQEETFGPVAVILVARDLDHALEIANDVPQGLVLSAYTRDERARERVREAAQAGIIQLAAGPLAVHPMAPFSGWKASGLGPPEHGVWDADFYSRVQALYTGESC